MEWYCNEVKVKVDHISQKAREKSAQRMHSMAFLSHFPPISVRECLDAVDFTEAHKEQRKKMAHQWKNNIQRMQQNKEALEAIHTGIYTDHP